MTICSPSVWPLSKKGRLPARIGNGLIRQGIPVIVNCIKKMRLAGLSEQEIAGLFRHAADELEKARHGS
jgi:hypothetical protein